MLLHRELPERSPRALFTDMDDTVAASASPVSAEMAAALDELQAAGLELALVSGATLEQMLEQVSCRLSRPHLLVATSGAQAVRAAGGAGGGEVEEIFRHAFSPSERAEIREALRWLIEAEGLRPDTDQADQLQDRGNQITLSGLGHRAALERKRAFDRQGSRRRQWVSHLEQKLGRGRFNIRVGGTTSLDITPRGVDKGSGVRELLQRLGWKAGDCLYFGDRFEETGNDHPLLGVMDCVAVKGPGETLELFRRLAARLRGKA